jgi:hypothetical protein
MAEIGIAVLNFITLFMSGFLTYKLYILFGWSTFKKMGASILINRLYRIATATFVSIHLTLFFLIAITSIWVDLLFKGFLGAGGAVHLKAYLGVYMTTIFLFPPWAIFAWKGIREERTRFMIGFFISSVVWLGGTWAMLASETFRGTFVSWYFFATISTVAFVGMFVTLVLGIICRLGFGKGLPEYLKQEPENTDENFHPSPDVEANGHAVAFPGESKNLHRSGSAASYGSYDEEKVGFPGEGPVSVSRQNTYDTFSYDNRPVELATPPSMYDPPRRPSPNTSEANNSQQQRRELYPSNSIGSKSTGLNPFDDYPVDMGRSDTISSFGFTDRSRSFGPGGGGGTQRSESFGPRGDGGFVSVVTLETNDSFGSVTGDRQALAAAQQQQPPSYLGRNASAGSTRPRLDLGEEMGGGRF